MRIDILYDPCKEDGILNVYFFAPPDPELTGSTRIPPIPCVPIGPIVTAKLSFGGKLYVWTVTLVSRTTERIVKVGNPE